MPSALRTTETSKTHAIYTTRSDTTPHREFYSNWSQLSSIADPRWWARGNPPALICLRLPKTRIFHCFQSVQQVSITFELGLDTTLPQLGQRPSASVRNMQPLVLHGKDAAHKTVYWFNWVYRYQCLEQITALIACPLERENLRKIRKVPLQWYQL
jgi:hypothetical protein